MPKPTVKVRINEETRTILVLELIPEDLSKVGVLKGAVIELSGEFMGSYVNSTVDYEATQRALEVIRDRGYA